MPKTPEEILGRLGLDVLPFAIGAGTFFAGNFVATGSLLGAAEIGVLAGFGATMAIAGVVVVGAIAVPVGIALALGSNDFAANASDAVHEVAPLLSPGVIGLLPMSPFFTPNDPTAFARAFGPAFDLGTGALSEGTLDKLGAEASAIAGFGGWKSDVVNLGNYYSSSPTSGFGQNTNGALPSPVPSGEPSAGDNHPNAGALNSDFNAPGDGDNSSNSIDSNAPPFFPELQTERYYGDSPDGSVGDGPSIDGAAGNSADSNASGGGNETSGENSGTENGGSGQTDEGSGGSGNSSDSGGSEGSGAGESSGGSSETGGSDKPDHPDPDRAY